MSSVDVAEEALAEVETEIVAHHLDEAFERRLVEAELFFDFLDESRVKTLCAAVTTGLARG
jgi:hypothetical protein